MLVQYIIMGLIIVVYNHLQVLGVSPHVDPTALLHRMREANALMGAHYHEEFNNNTIRFVYIKHMVNGKRKAFHTLLNELKLFRNFKTHNTLEKFKISNGSHCKGSGIT